MSPTEVGPSWFTGGGRHPAQHATSMGKDKLRIRRLTLEPKAITEAAKEHDVQGEVTLDHVNELSLAAEHLHWVVEVAIASSSMHRPQNVHGVEDGIGSRFWARESETDEVNQLRTHLRKLAINSSSEHGNHSGYSISMRSVASSPMVETQKVELRLNTMGDSSTGSVTSTQSKVQMKPWTGPLPCHRISPKRSINEVIAKRWKVQSFLIHRQMRQTTAGDLLRRAVRYIQTLKFVDRRGNFRIQMNVMSHTSQ
jgi:hypothetical protein